MATERTNDSSEANLHLEYPQVEITASVKLPNAKKAVVADATHAAALVPPVLTNKTPVDKHTRLVAINDLNLQKIDLEPIIVTLWCPPKPCTYGRPKCTLSPPNCAPGAPLLCTVPALPHCYYHDLPTHPHTYLTERNLT